MSIAGTDLNSYFRKHHKGEAYSQVPRITCADGFSISVQVNECAYCQPRNSRGPWYEVECGFPSAAPPTVLMQFAEDPSRPTETVYGYVPIEIVEGVIDGHGGMDGGMSFYDAKNEYELWNQPLPTTSAEEGGT